MDDDALAIEYDMTPRSGGDRKSAPARNSTNLKTRKRGLKRGVDGELSLNEHVYVEFTPEGKFKMRDGEKLKGQWSAEEDGRLADLVASTARVDGLTSRVRSKTAWANNAESDGIIT